MALAKIKDQHASTVIAFGNSGLPLGKRDDIDDLAIIALESGNPNLLNLFEKLPTLEELKKKDTDNALKKSAAVIKTKELKEQPVEIDKAENDPIKISNKDKVKSE